MTALPAVGKLDWAHPQEGRETDDVRVDMLREQHDPLPFYLRRGLTSGNIWACTELLT
jgi:hypothetical protein